MAYEEVVKLNSLSVFIFVISNLCLIVYLIYFYVACFSMDIWYHMDIRYMVVDAAI